MCHICVCGGNLLAQSDSIPIFDENQLNWKEEYGCGSSYYINRIINKEIQYPVEALAKGTEGVVTFSLTLYKDTLFDFEILSDPGDGCGDVVLQKLNTQLVRHFWHNPIHNGNYVHTRITRHIHFRLADTSITYHIHHPDMNGPFESVKDWRMINKIYDMFDIVHPPTFPGGDGEMIKYMHKEIAWDCCSKEERTKPGNIIVAGFLVDKTGRIHHIEFIKNSLPCTTESIITALKGKQWMYGQANGCPVWVQMKMRIPIQKE
ncbi:MAG: hypothetical protein JNJ90_18890 [Saprospiraceae bacterium]|nr:hypothetical protein [Saprospiraceae bacterium]